MVIGKYLQEILCNDIDNKLSESYKEYGNLINFPTVLSKKHYFD